MEDRRARGMARRLTLLVAIAGTVALGGGTRVGAGTNAFPPFLPIEGTEGIAVDKCGTVYVSTRNGAVGSVFRLSRTGQRTLVAELGEAKVGGLAFAANGDLYAAMAEGPDQGVYRIERSGAFERLPGTEQIAYANALAFDHRGTLYVSESYSRDGEAYGPGGIWRIPRHAEAEPWLRHPLLTGVGAVLGYPVGANGVVFLRGALYVANTDKGLVVRVPVLRDGRPGTPEVWARLQEVACSPMAGSPFPLMPDGLALDAHGNVYATVVSRNAVVRFDARTRAQQTVVALGAVAGCQAAPLDTPASLAFSVGTGMRTMLHVTNLGWMSTIVPGPAWPGPGVVTIPVSAPGRPLP